jgi:hypothetical protein
MKRLKEDAFSQIKKNKKKLINCHSKDLSLALKTNLFFRFPKNMCNKKNIIFHLYTWT